MKKKNSLITFLIVVIGFLLGIFLEYKDIGDPYPSELLYIFFGAALLPALAMLLLPHLLRNWLRFTLWWGIGTAIVVILVPEYHGDLFPIFSFDRREAIWFMGALFTVISLTIIGVKSIQLRRK